MLLWIMILILASAYALPSVITTLAIIGLVCSVIATIGRLYGQQKAKKLALLTLEALADMETKIDKLYRRDGQRYN